MSGYELRGAPSGRVWRMAERGGAGELVTEARAIEVAQDLGWELHEVADDGTDRVIWSPPGVEISEREANAIADLAIADAQARGFKIAGGLA